ncbi:MAG: YdcF family protein [Eubacteriales bacterium]|nr:YdcF family protein [Eubacteriales bacterium]
MSFTDVYTEFIFVEDAPREADVIFVPGSGEGALAVRAAELWREGYAPFVLPSGKYGKLAGRFEGEDGSSTEWEYLSRILLREGVPAEAILREDQATYTYENAMFSRRVTDRMGLSVRTALLCCQAYHARRALLYYQVCFPEAAILVCPTVTKGVSRDSWYRDEQSIRLVLGEMERCGSQFGGIFMEQLKKEECYR